MVETKTVNHKEPQGRENDRGGWNNRLDFLFSCIGLSVGLGNVWRFPYLCYKNGGGAFLVTYTVGMVLCGIPLFFQEVAIGQYLGSGGCTLVGDLCPILQGVGYATMTMVFLLDIYYCIVIAWTLFYLVSSFVQFPELPWGSCGNWWNTESCSVPGMNVTSNNSRSPVEEYWENRVLGLTSGIQDLGGMRWELFACLVVGWIFVYLIIRRGIHQSGKVLWFTAIFPYVILIILLIRGVLLPGAKEGLLYYITPEWSQLLTVQPWIDGATQIFFAYSIGTGALPALGSYNSFHHNCYRDAVITCIINTFTSLLAGCVTFSILGHIALEQNTSVADVVKSGPGLVFLTYPEVVLKLPGSTMWAAVFFFMLLILGIDSEFCLVESFITGIVDKWSDTLRPHRSKVTIGICILLFLLGIPMTTHGGVYIFNLMDTYSASGMSLLWVCFFQTVAISWIFGADQFIECIDQMMGRRPGKMWYLCWVYFAPLTMVIIFGSQLIEYVPATYGSYSYPDWAQGIGILLSLASMLWVPAYAIYYLIVTPGSFKQKLKSGLKPKVKLKKSTKERPVGLPPSESSAGLLTRNSSFIIGSKPSLNSC